MNNPEHPHWIQTYSGLAFDFTTLEPLNFSDIGHALGQTCRYAGHTRMLYSVAEHSVLVARLVRRAAEALGLPHRAASLLSLAGLLHDASEAYLGDVTKPLKGLLIEREAGAYARLEGDLQRAIYRFAGLDPAQTDHWLIKAADDALLWHESAVVFKSGPRYPLGPGYIDIDREHIAPGDIEFKLSSYATASFLAELLTLYSYLERPMPL